MTSELLKGLLAANFAAGLAILVVLAARGLVRRRFGARIAYQLWLAPVVAGLAVFIPAPKGLGLTPSLPVATFTQDILQTFGPAANPAPAGAAVVVSGPGWAMPDLATLLLAAWLAGALVAIGLTLLAHRRGLASFGRLESSSARGPLRAAHHGLGPALIGIWRPRLVLPADFEARFAAREQALILAHERHHSDSGDVRINALVSLVGCLNWFNPLVHLAAHWLRVDQELACDAAVVERFPGERRTYAEALLKSQLACIPLPLGCTWPGASSQLLQERLTMLAYDKPRRARLMAGGALVGALCLTAGAFAWAAGADPASPPSMAAAPQAAAVDIPASYSPKGAESPKPAVSQPAAPAEDAPTTIGFACMSNSCGGQAAPTPRDPAAIAAAAKAGDLDAARAAGGSAREVLDIWLADMDGGPLVDGHHIAELIKPGSVQFETGVGGAAGIGYDVEGLGHRTTYRVPYPAPAGAAAGGSTASAAIIGGAPTN